MIEDPWYEDEDDDDVDLEALADAFHEAIDEDARPADTYDKPIDDVDWLKFLWEHDVDYKALDPTRPQTLVPTDTQGAWITPDGAVAVVLRFDAGWINLMQYVVRHSQHHSCPFGDGSLINIGSLIASKLMTIDPAVRIMAADGHHDDVVERLGGTDALIVDPDDAMSCEPTRPSKRRGDDDGENPIGIPR